MSRGKTPTGITVTLQAVPSVDFSRSTHRGSIRISPREVAIAQVADAVQVVLAFITEHDLDAGNWGGRAGLVCLHGLPVCHAACNGSLWAVDAAGWETGEPYVPAEPAQPRFAHLGRLVIYLRTAAGLSRIQLGRGTTLGAHTIKALESGRVRLTQAQLDKLLRAPAMSGLLELAEREGVEVELVPEPEGGGAGGVAGGT